MSVVQNTINVTFGACVQRLEQGVYLSDAAPCHCSPVLLGVISVLYPSMRIFNTINASDNIDQSAAGDSNERIKYGEDDDHLDDVLLDDPEFVLSYFGRLSLDDGPAIASDAMVGESSNYFMFIVLVVLYCPRKDQRLTGILFYLDAQVIRTVLCVLVLKIKDRS